jgi:hypothetical protein
MHIRRIAANHRAQASGFIVFFLILAIGALLWGVLNVATVEIFQVTASQTTEQQAKDVINQREAIWNNLLFFIIAFAGVFLIARAVFQSRV